MTTGPRNENEIRKENERITDYHDEILQIEMLFQSSIISVGYKEYSVENYVDKKYFSLWKGRENCDDTDAMRRGLNIDGILSKPDPTKNEVLTYLQYTLNIAELCRRSFNEFRGRNYDFNIKRYTELLTSIRKILRELDYDVRYVPDKEIIYLVARNIAADAVADYSADVETDKIIEYNSFATVGNLEKKRDILLSMGDTIESYPDNMAPGNVKLYSGIEFMLHNFNIRTDNRTGEDRVEYVAGMSEEELEKWYDEAYQMMLLRILQNENQKRLERVEAVQAACEARSVEELKHTIEAEGADRIITNRRVAEYESAGERPEEIKSTEAEEEIARQLKKRAEAAKERLEGRENEEDSADAESAVSDMIKTAGAKKAVKPSETAESAASYDGSGSDSPNGSQIDDTPETKREEKIPNEKERTQPSQRAKSGKKKKHGFVKLLAAVMLLIAAAACALYFYINSFYREADYISDSQVPENLNAEILPAEEGRETLSEAEAELISADASAARRNAAVFPMASRNVKNILLVVADRKADGSFGSADGIVLASVNTTVKKITFYALRTDLYAEIPGHGVGRIGAATACGGCPLLARTITDTYGIPVVNYISTDLKGLANLINDIDGIPEVLSGEEMTAPDAMIGTDVRIGQVMEGIFKKIGANDTGRRLKKILPYTTHNIPMGAVLSGLPAFAGIFSYETETVAIPPEGMHSSAKGLLVPEFDRFFAFLAETLSGKAAESKTAGSAGSTQSAVQADSTAAGNVSPEADIPEPKITPEVPWALAPAA